MKNGPAFIRRIGKARNVNIGRIADHNATRFSAAAGAVKMVAVMTETKTTDATNKRRMSGVPSLRSDGSSLLNFAEWTKHTRALI